MWSLAFSLKTEQYLIFLHSMFRIHQRSAETKECHRCNTQDIRLEVTVQQLIKIQSSIKLETSTYPFSKYIKIKNRKFISIANKFVWSVSVRLTFELISTSLNHVQNCNHVFTYCFINSLNIREHLINLNTHTIWIHLYTLSRSYTPTLPLLTSSVYRENL